MTWVDGINRLAEKATPGPWTAHTKHLVEEARVLTNRPELIALCDGRRHLQYEDNAEFIAACSPERVLALARVHKAAESWFENPLRGRDDLRDALAAVTALEEGE